VIAGTVVAVAAVLGWGGCRRARAPIPLEPAYLEQEVLPELRARTRLTETIWAQMTLEVESGKERSEVRQILRYKRPDKFRLDVLDPMSNPRVVIVADGDLLRMFYVREYEGIEGPVTDETLRRVTRMDIRVSDIQIAVHADPFLDGDAREARLAQDGAGIVVRRPSVRPGHEEEIVVGRWNGQPIVEAWVVRQRGGPVVQEVRFSDYREVDGLLKPMTVVINRAKEGTRLRFHAVQAKVNRDVSDAAFNLQFPPSAKVQRLK
jgi:outer membrane lipoprotein-sorting protein